jgi:hypothetical protein
MELAASKRLAEARIPLNAMLINERSSSWLSVN